MGKENHENLQILIVVALNERKKYIFILKKIKIKVMLYIFRFKNIFKNSLNITIMGLIILRSEYH